MPLVGVVAHQPGQASALVVLPHEAFGVPAQEHWAGLTGLSHNSVMVIYSHSVTVNKMVLETSKLTLQLFRVSIQRIHADFLFDKPHPLHYCFSGEHPWWKLSGHESKSPAVFRYTAHSGNTKPVRVNICFLFRHEFFYSGMLWKSKTGKFRPVPARFRPVPAKFRPWFFDDSIKMVNSFMNDLIFIIVPWIGIHVLIQYSCMNTVHAHMHEYIPKSHHEYPIHEGSRTCMHACIYAIHWASVPYIHDWSNQVQSIYAGQMGNLFMNPEIMNSNPFRSYLAATKIEEIPARMSYSCMHK